jgi:L1 cell adhesion molecule like protein
MYREAMKKHFKNEPFTKPVDFVLLHENFFRKCCTKYGKSNLDIQQKIQEALKPLYTKYCEKNNMNTPGAPAIGIDLGTTYCCVAIYQHGKVNIIPNEFGNNTIPSFIALLPSGELIGENAKLQAHENPTQTIFDSKRLIGRKFNEKEVLADMALWPFKVVDDLSIPKIEVTGRKYAAEVVSAKLLKHIKNVAEKYLKGTEVKNAVITVPAYFNDGQRQATKDAAEIAGLNVLQIINEPTAAAIAYHLHRTEAGSHNVLVYDLGGGTFDVSVLTMNGGKIEVKAVGGDTHLGGEDFDQALVNHCVIKFQQQHGINLAQGKGSLREIEVAQASRTLRRLRNECENRKKDLSSSPSTTIAVATIHGHLDLNIPLTRVEFENLNIARFNQTIGIVQKALADAKIRKEEIHEVVLVGGSTRIPKVRELLKAFFNGKELCTSVNADEAVAYGAAIQAAILNGCQEQKLQRISLKDVTPMSLGIEVIGERHSVIIPRNTSVPADRTQTYTTTSDYQTQIRVAIYEGEDPAATRNYLLGEFLLTGLPAKRRGVEKVLVTMKVDAEGILHVSAVCTSNKVFGNITIVEHKGRLTRAEIEEERKYLQEEVP